MAGLATGRLVLTEPDIVALEGGARAWWFGGVVQGQASGLSPLETLGTPVFGAPVYGALWAPNLAYAWLSPARAAGVLWFLYAGVFVIGWVAALAGTHRSVRGLAVAAAVWAASSGPLWSQHAVSLFGAASLSCTGWAAWAGRRFAARPGARRGAVVGFVAGLALLAGDPLAAVLCCGLALAFALSRTRSRKGAAAIPAVALRRWGAGVAAAAIASLAITLPILVEGRRMLSMHARGDGLSAYESLSFSTPVQRWPALLLDALAPSRDDRALLFSGSMNADFWFPSLCFGVVAMGLLIGGTKLRRRSPVPALLAAVGATGATLTLGGFWSPAAWIWTHVPPLSQLRFPERLWPYVVVLVLPLVFEGTRWFRAVGRRRGFGRTLAWLPWLAALEVIVQRPQGEMREVGSAPELPSALVELQQKARDLHPVRLGFFRIGPDGARADLRGEGVAMVHPVSTLDAPILKYLAHEDLRAPWTASWLGMTHVVAAKLDARQSELRRRVYAWEDAPPASLTDRAALFRTGARPDRPLFLSRVRVAPALQGIDLGAGGVPRGRTEAFTKAFRDGLFFLDPRHSLDDNGRLQPLPAPLVKRAGMDDTDASLVARGCPTKPLVGPTLSGDLRRGFEVSVRAPCAGWLSFPWRLVPGWRGTVDGEPVPLARIGDLTLAVFLEPGVHEVRLAYELPTLGGLPLVPVAVAAQGLGWLGLLLSLRRDRSRRRRRPTDPRADEPNPASGPP